MRTDAVIDEIKQRLDIVEVIGRSVALKKAGRSYKGFCPFHHNTHTEALMVFPHTGTWHCFGACGTGGDIFSFVQKREGLGFREALELLAREAGIELAPQNQAQAEAQSRREQLREVAAAAARLFHEWLHQRADAAHCRDYLARRGVADETVARFALGYAPNSWDALLGALGPAGRGFQPDDLAAVGLIKPNDSGGFYDAFRHRLIFPIRDVRGRVIGFGGRALSDEQIPKYLNSPQTELFDKGRTLYALDLAREAIRREDRTVIVEGYMDAIAAHQAGFTNVVASLGTALTPDQIRLLKRFSANLTLALDADDAGSAATRRGIATARESLDRQSVAMIREGGLVRQGFELASDLRILALPAGYDPDDLIKEAPERWATLVAQAKPVVEYLFESTIAGLNLDDPLEKRRAAEELLPVVAEIGDVIARSHYLQRLARLLRVDERDLATQMVALSRTATIPRRPPPASTTRRTPTPFADEPPPFDDDGFFPDEEDPFGGTAPTATTRHAPAVPPRPLGTEEWLLFLLMQRPETLHDAIAAGLAASDWVVTQNRALFEALLATPPESALALDEWAEELDATLVAHLRQILHYYSRTPPIPDGLWARAFQDALDKVKLHADRRAAQRLHFLINEMAMLPPAERDSAQLQAAHLELKAVSHRILQRERAILARTESAKLRETLGS